MTELYINNTLVDLTANIPLPITYQISDITDPSKRNSDYSKTINVYGTKNNNELFTNIYQLDKDILTNNSKVNFSIDFNPSLKANCELYENNLLQLKGYVRMTNITIDKFGTIVYSIQILGSIGNFVADLKDLKLTDLDVASNVSDNYNNITVSKTGIINTWNVFNSLYPTDTSDDVYYTIPVIDLGYNTYESQFQINKLYPAFTNKGYLDVMFKTIGYKYKSNFLNSTKFKRIITPYTDEGYSMSENEKNKRTMYAGTTGATITNTSPYNNFGKWYWNSSTNKYNTSILFETLNIENTDLPYFDISGMNLKNGEFKFNKTGFYNITINLRVDFHRFFTFNGIDYRFDWLDRGVNYQLVNVNNSSNSYSLIKDQFDNVDLFNQTYTITNKRFEAGSVYRLGVNILAFATAKRVSNNQPLTGHINYLPFTPTVVAGSSVLIEPVTTNFYSGDTYSSIDLNSFIPKDVKCADFFKSILNQFNLIVDIDKSDLSNKTLIIEPAIDYYSSGKIIDLTNKVDKSQSINIVPASQLEGKDYQFSFKKDADYYSQNYTTIWNENYGDKLIETNNDFFDKTKEIPIIFSSTPSVRQTTSDLIIPTIYDANVSTGIIKPRKSNIRQLYGSNVMLSANYSLAGTNNTGTGTVIESMNTYPWYSHTDHPYTPTFDLLFSVPKQIFWQLPSNGYYTNNNNYNQYWKQFIDELTDINSKLVTCYIDWTAEDIYNLSFKDVFQINNVNYRLQRIIDYDPSTNKTTKTEFVKINKGSKFISSTIELDTASNQLSYSLKIDGGANTVQDVTYTFNVLNGGVNTIGNAKIYIGGIDSV